MNPLVPWDFEHFDTYLDALNSMFGDVVKTDFGYFDADIEQIPPFADEFPGKSMTDCFVFAEIGTKPCKSWEECWINLIEAIEESIDRQMSYPRDTSKATMVWRTEPEISMMQSKWIGYARFRVLDKQSKRSFYGGPFPYSEDKDKRLPFWNFIREGTG